MLHWDRISVDYKRALKKKRLFNDMRRFVWKFNQIFVVFLKKISVHLLIVSTGILRICALDWFDTDSVCNAEVIHRRVLRNECIYNVHRFT